MDPHSRELRVLGTRLEPVIQTHVLVEWRHGGSGRTMRLGRLDGTAGGANKARLTLDIRQNGKATLISIHVPVKLRPSTSERPRDMFLVVPAERLLASVAAYNVDGDDTRALKLCLGLGQRAFTVMPVPRRRTQRPLAGAPAEIVKSLKVLSEVQNLTLHLPNNEPTCSRLSDALDALQAEDAQTPLIDYHSTYDHGTRADVNCWSEYPYRDEKAGLPWNPFVEDAPPPYDEAVQTPHLQPDRKSPDADAASARSGPSAVLIWNTEPTESNKEFKDASPLNPGRKRTISDCLSDAADKARQLDYWLDAGTLSPTEADPTQEDGGRDSSLPGGDADEANCPERPETVDNHPMINTSQPLPSQEVADARSTPSCVPCTLPQDPEGTSSSGISSAVLFTPDPFYDLTQWLLYTLKARPSVHDEFRIQLLELGLYARTRATELFKSARDECMRSFIRKAAAAGDAAPSPWPAVLEDQVEYLRCWVNANVAHNADVHLVGQLVDLQRAATRAIEAGDDGALLHDFERARAICLATAFLLYGGRECPHICYGG